MSALSTSNRVVVVPCTRNHGAEADPGYCINVDQRILSDRPAEAAALAAVIAQYEVFPATPQWCFAGADTTTRRLRFATSAEAEQVTQQLVAGQPAAQTA